MIRSTFAGFATAQSALTASQKALDVTGQNISNVNVSGYTRQRLDLYSRSSGGYFSLYANGNKAEVGYGVIINGVSQIRDKFLDIRFRSEACGMGEAETKLEALTDLARVFDKISIEGLDAQMTDMIEKLQSLSTNVDGVEFDAMVRSSAEVLVNMFNQYAKQISDISDDQKAYLDDSILDVNGILENIASLNKNIKAAQLGGNSALELQDQRNVLLDELSHYMNIDIQYTPTVFSSGLTVEDVEVRLVVPGTPANTYITLVENTNAAKFEYKDNVNGDAEIWMEGANGETSVNMNDSITAGSLKGLLDVINKAGEFDGSDMRGIKYYTMALDSLVAEFASRFNEANQCKNPAYTTGSGLPEFLERDLFSSKVVGEPITAANICVAPGWLDNSYGITKSKEDLPDDSTGAVGNVLYMISLFSEKYDLPVLGEGTFQGLYSKIGTTLDMDQQAATVLAKNYDTVMNEIYDMRESISAVNLDEEGINLLRYQKSYNAAARLMTTLDEALNTIINGMGIVGR